MNKGHSALGSRMGGAVLSVPFLFFFIFFMAGLTFAQVRTAGSIAGSVTDPSGAVVAGAEVTIRSEATNVSKTVKTSSAGEYLISNLAPGGYTVTVERDGFQKAVRENVLVAVGTDTLADVQLIIGTMAQYATVVAHPVPINETSANLGIDISPATLESLPLQINGSQRSLTTFVFLDSSTQGGDTFSYRLNGTPATSQDMITDGMSYTTALGLGPNFSQPPFEAVDEFRIEKNAYSAQNGRSTSALNFHFKSGSNQFHGDVYDLLRNNVLDAPGHFAPSVGNYKQNEYGVTAGGPVFIPKLYNGHDKTFWFFTYSGFKQRGGISNSLITVPTADFVQGDFTKNFDSSGNLIPIFDPATTRPDGLGGFTRDQFQCNGVLNVICPDRISSISKSFAALMPVATLPGTVNNLVTSVPSSPTNDYNMLLKFDHHLNDKYVVHGHYQRSITSLGVSPLFDTPLAPYEVQTSKGWAVQAALDQTISPNAQNTIGFLYNLSAGVTPLLPVNNQLNTPISPTGFGYPALLIPGMVQFGKGTAIPPANDGYGYVINDTLNWLRGRHNLNIGADLRWLNASGNSNDDYPGTFNFSNLTTSLPNATDFSSWGNGFASFLLGLPVNVDSHSITPTRIFNTRYFAFYLQDDFRVSKKLTLNLGLRWDLPVGVTESHNQLSTLSLTTPNPGAGNLPGALVFAGQSGGACLDAGGASLCKSRLADLDYKEWQPRIGFAYRLDNRTVVRGGYGIFFFGGGSNVTFGPGILNFFSTGYTSDLLLQSPDGGTSPIPGINPGNLGTVGWDQGIPPVPALDKSLTAANGSTIDYWDPRSGRNPYIQEWSFGLQRELPGRIALEVGYAGNKGTRIGASQENLDQVQPKWLVLGNELGADITCLGNGGCPNAVAAGVRVPYPGFTGSVSQALRPFPQFASIISEVQESGSSTYNSLQARAQKYFSQGVTFLVTYTFSKELSNTWCACSAWHPAFNGVLNTYDRQASKALEWSSVPQSLVASGVYELPIGPKKRFVHVGGPVGKVLGGWKVGWIASYQSGAPLGFSGGPPLPLFSTGGNRPNMVPGQNPVAYHGGTFNPATDLYLNPAAFSQPGPFQIGTAPVFDPHARSFARYNEQISLIKRTEISESMNVEFRVEAFNAFNRTVYGAPDTNLNDTAGFGRVSNQANQPRVIQGGLKFNW